MDGENPYKAPQSSEPSPPRADGRRRLAIAVANYAKIAAVVALICGFMGWISFKVVMLLTIPMFFVQLPALFFRARWMGWAFLILFVAVSAWIVFFVTSN
jgi:hypothetical protein